MTSAAGRDPDAPRTIEASDGAVIAYRIWRPGPPRQLLVLLHGVASNMTRWSEFVSTTRLRSAWDLLRLDLRGHGRSIHRGRIGMSEWCDDLAVILAAEGYRQAVVAGHCLGAAIAVHFAARHPASARGLVLIEPTFRAVLAGRMRQVGRFRPLFVPAAWLVRAMNAAGIHRRRLDTLDLERLDRETRAAIAAGGAAAALLGQYASPWLDLRTTPSAVYLQSLIAMTGPLPDLARVTAPVLALLSSASAFGDPEATAALLGQLPRCEILRLEARHWIPTEQPEAMRRAIEGWCDRLGR